MQTKINGTYKTITNLKRSISVFLYVTHDLNIEVKINEATVEKVKSWHREGDVIILNLNDTLISLIRVPQFIFEH